MTVPHPGTETCNLPAAQSPRKHYPRTRWRCVLSNTVQQPILRWEPVPLPDSTPLNSWPLAKKGHRRVHMITLVYNRHTTAFTRNSPANLWKNTSLPLRPQLSARVTRSRMSRFRVSMQCDLRASLDKQSAARERGSWGEVLCCHSNTERHI